MVKVRGLTEKLGRQSACGLLLLGTTAACAPESLYRVVRVTPRVTILSRGPAKAGRLVTMRYSWRVDPGFRPPAVPHRVFVHFLLPDKQLAFTDDHDPSPPVPQWKAGAAYEYERPVILPDNPSDLTVRVGIFSSTFPYKARVLDSVSQKPGFPAVATIHVVENADGIEEAVGGGEGFYRWERDGRTPAHSWRWTQSRATFVFLQRPEGVALLLQGRVERERLSKDASVFVRVDGAEARRTLANGDRVVITLDVPGDGKVRLAQGSLETDTAFRDAGRELGFCVERFRAVPLSELKESR